MTTHTNGHPAVEVHQLTKTYPGGVQAVKAIDFSVAPGEVFGLLGPNGAGKSTTIGMLTTTIAPTTGTAVLVGFDVAREPLKARSVSSVVFQEAVVDRGLTDHANLERDAVVQAAVLHGLTGRANLELHAKLWALALQAASARITDLAETLGLDEIVDRGVD